MGHEIIGQDGGGRPKGESSVPISTKTRLSVCDHRPSGARVFLSHPATRPKLALTSSTAQRQVGVKIPKVSILISEPMDSGDNLSVCLNDRRNLRVTIGHVLPT